MDTNFNKNTGRVNDVGFSGIKKPTKKNEKTAPELKQVEESAQKALGFMGRAFIDMQSKVSFKGNVGEKTTEITGLSDEEFKEKKKEIKTGIKSLDNDSLKNLFNGLKFNKFNIFIAEKLLNNPQIMKNESVKSCLRDIIYYTDSKERAEGEIQLFNYLKDNPSILENEIVKSCLGDTICFTDSKERAEVKIQLFNYLKDNPSVLENESVKSCLGDMIRYADSKESAEGKIQLFNYLKDNPSILDNESVKSRLGNIIYYTDSKESAEGKIQLCNYLKDNPSSLENEIVKSRLWDIICFTDSKESAEVKIQLFNYLKDNPSILENESVKSYLGDMIRYTDSKESAEGKIQLCNYLKDNPSILDNESVKSRLGNIICYINSKESAEGKIQLFNYLKDNPSFLENESVKSRLWDIIRYTNSKESAEGKIQLFNYLKDNPSILENEIVKSCLKDIICYTDSKESAEVAKYILDNPSILDNESVKSCFGDIISCTDSKESAEVKIQLFNYLKDNPSSLENESVKNCLRDIICFTDSKKDADRIINFIEKAKDDPNFANIRAKDFLLGAELIGLYNAKDINEIPIGEKRDILRGLVSCNTELFKTSEAFKAMFPLIPKNQEEYCELLPQLVKSIGIESKDLNEDEIKEFDKSLVSLSDSLASLSNDDFNNLEITQSYSKEEFIKDTLDIVKDLDNSERQKVYDYFGFELKENENSEIGYSIFGYPKNINNGKKLTQIEDGNTKAVVEKLREKVIKFSEDNHISANGNKGIEEELNGLVKAFPELRTMIGKAQHGTHDFDLIMHSMKVIQNFSKNPEFNKLNESDKRLMVLAGLFHDITKAEGRVDKTHAKESAFDCSFLVERLGLSQDEEFKLNNLIKNHEWLEYANSGKSENDTTKRLRDVAYDFRFDNSFDMAMMFTKADLLAVKKDNNDGNIFATNYMNKALEFEPIIRANIEELKKSQPLLPVTKIPKASEIEKAITVVNEDGSTNIKGVYKDKKGLVIIKFNEVKDWEKIGFPKGTTSNGIQTTTSRGDNVNTGNIHFFAHGLDYPNQLVKFDAFSLSDSDALLSVSYAEHPESKYRFFRPQGVVLDCDTKYIHGGGETDAGSGHGKDIQNFKDNYIFDGYRKKDRLYISNLIKEALKMDDAEYIQFVKENENRTFSEIEPKEVREKIIKAFAEINSNTRRGNRSYNEMYISNPRPPMAVFAYEMENGKKIEDTIKFLDETSKRTAFLQDYARERDIPFIIFGD